MDTFCLNGFEASVYPCPAITPSFVDDLLR